MKASPDNCMHLTVAIVLQIHDGAISRFGGIPDGINTALLESAVAAPQVTVSGSSPFTSLTEIAAAYLYYLCANHPFTDGNKRTALGACILFLRLNGVQTTKDNPKWEQLTFAIAEGKIDRKQATAALKLILKELEI